MAYAPKLGGGGPAQAFPLQFPDSDLSPISLSCTPIFQLSNDGLDTTISHGSGFFWRQNERIFLITARHVLSGLDPFENKPLSTKGYIPRRFGVFATIDVKPNTWQRTPIIVEINPDAPKPWLEDPEFEILRTDIAAVELTSQISGPTHCVNDTPDIFGPILTLVGFGCTIVGYPHTNLTGLMTPIWRSGAIASEPRLPVDGKPMFLVDAATSPGFSGSPVFRIHYGPAPVRNPDGNVSILVDRVMTTSFVGVYAGRLLHSHVGGEVPFVFYGNRIPKILAQS